MIVGAFGLAVVVACGQDREPFAESIPITSTDGGTTDVTAPAPCSEGATESRPCGACDSGIQERLCEKGAWLEWSYCQEKAGTCKPGEEKRSRCDRCVERCSDTCSFAPIQCPADLCEEGTIEERPGTCPPGFTESRVCGSSCAFDAWAPCAPPKGWTAIAPLPAGVHGRSRYVAGFHGGTMYVAGGFSGNLFDQWETKPVLAYTLATNTWAEKAAAPFETIYASGVWIDDGFVLLESITGAIARYDIATNTWTPLPAPPFVIASNKRTQVSLAYAKSTRELVVWGGYDNDTSIERGDGAAYKLDAPTGWRSLPAGPVVGAASSLFVAGSRLHVVKGGGDDGWATASLDLATTTWGAGLGINVPRGANVLPDGAALWGGLSYKLSGGGFESSRKLTVKDALGYTTLDIPTSVLANPRRVGLGTWFDGDRVCGWGGASYAYGSPSGNDHADGACYDRVTQSWTKLPASGLDPRAQITAVWTGREVILWGGETSDFESDIGQTLDDGKVYRP